MRMKHCLVLIGFACLASAMFLAAPVAAEPMQPSAAGQSADNESCLACHGTPGQTTEFPSGEALYISIDPETFNESVHGQAGYACVQCHSDITGYPHPPLGANSRREYVVQQYTTCARCHEDKYDLTLDSVHQKALAGGNLEAAVCTDCHGVHDVSLPEDRREDVPHMCERCHSEIHDLYAQSAHGTALMDESNPDVPTCTDCHGVHSVEGPTDSQFHLSSPEICAGCHADPELMGRYGISTDVFDTYVADFHGTTVKLFEQTSPDQETNKPVCIDCHGVHDMRSVDDPESTVIKENLLQTCQRCHPDATTNFPDSWLGHYRPSAEQWPMVYAVDLFYKLLIPAVIGAMVIYNFTDIFRLVADWWKRRRND